MPVIELSNGFVRRTKGFCDAGIVSVRRSWMFMNSSPNVPILVADDSEDNRFLLQAYCMNTKYDLTFAEDGEKAVEAFRVGAFDIVIMDLQMPNMDGLTAARRIRDMEADRGGRRIPILALSANVMPQDVAGALAAGCDHHLPKPISKTTFLGALDHWKPHLQ